MPAPFVLLFFLLAWTKETQATDHNMPFMEYLDQNQLVCLKWGFDNLEGNITFQLTVNTTGWVGLGFSPTGEMYEADIVIGGIGPNGTYFTDRYATQESLPLVDEDQSYTLLSLTEKDGQTTMTFQRSIQSCDDKDFHFTAEPVKLIYAYGTTDDIKYHGPRRGTKGVNLLNYMPKTTPPDAKYLSVKVDNITVPESHTYYHCKVLKLPSLVGKYHIFQIEPEIEQRDIVHHMLLYSCPSSVKDPYDKECYKGDIGDACFGVVASWAVGGGVFELPENAGIPIGTGYSDIFYRLEIHYNNPQGKAGLSDSSGLRLYYTDQLRQHDVGILQTGVLSGRLQYLIPPKAAQFHTYSICNTSYFSQLVNPMPELQVFAVLLHTHLAGRKIRVGHFRNGTQIGFLAVDEHYKFEMQQIVSVGSIKTIRQDDEIAVECTYNTEDRTGTTKFGLSTTEEMCLAFLFYYPAIRVTTCISHPNTALLSNESSQISEATDIVKYEAELKALPQVQQILSPDKNLFYGNGRVRDLMKTPTTKCVSKNTASSVYTFWSTGQVLLLLFWILIMYNEI